MKALFDQAAGASTAPLRPLAARRSLGRRPAPVLVSTLLAACLLWGLAACSRPTSEAGNTAIGEGDSAAPNPLRNAYFGDLHIHTAYSFDAFLFAARATPDDAYRYCSGEAIDHPAGYRVQLESGPLDFCAVTDHAMYLGVLPATLDPDSELSKLPAAATINAAKTADERKENFFRASSLLRTVPQELQLEAARSAWKDIVEAAERHDAPGALTTFVGYEYTSAPDSQNLHRNVIFRGSRVPSMPFSRFDSPNPEDLWGWLDSLRADGIEALAIPHNSNGSNGQMFSLTTFAGEPFDVGYAEIRMRNEPLVEVAQVKGASEVHPLLSPNDEWADFEIYSNRIGTNLPSEMSGSYVREAYKNGLLLEETEGLNPFRFGLIGSSDTHNGAAPLEEDDYFGIAGAVDGTPQLRGSVPMDTPPRPNGQVYVHDGKSYVNDVAVPHFGSAGLAGVWAEENSREAIYDALRRKETFATSGPRIRVRFFAGFDYTDELVSDPQMLERAYAGGVPMGGDLVGRANGVPRFLVWATRDTGSAPLQRIQVIKGWVENGDSEERVFDVACSDGLEPDPATRRCPDNGAHVDLTDCSISPDRGAGELRTLWKDPDFEPDQRALYYVRVLENPTCRWSTWDAIRAGIPRRPDLPATLQERAWTSPIWYVPVER